MSGSYKCPLGWNCWAPAGNTAITIYMQRYPVTAPDMNSILLPFLVVTFFPTWNLG